MKVFLIAAAAALSVTAANAHPGPGGGPPNPDADGDGKVSLTEFRASQSARQDRMFTRTDTNTDGKITKNEADAMAQRAQARRRGGAGGGVMRLDLNNDGSVTQAEMAAMTRRRFEMADANQDGWLSKEEMPMMRQRMRGAPGPK